ncbi:uncharacterized protein PV09_03754 [Verruconis gallopava]|uniref:Uncharacterized protein n=1 Tax=Verruconis gallopava TaxID=253628 RepID=A0A0D1XR88_9PEZI|nr:uncharacterized protein PV09_03754 [Verruconis gallopava]KIW05211.1 hypothetical protein PV09_03754 [Verruconis gallopava]
MKTSGLFKLPGSVLLLSIRAAFAQQLPYNPTHIFLSPQNELLAYVLQPADPAGSQFTLSSLDLTSGIDASNLPLQTISSSLPFLDNGTNIPFNAIIDSNGNITIYTGACGGDAQIWKLNTQGRELGLPDWRQVMQSEGSAVNTGPQYLSSAIAFASNVTATATGVTYYFFGGMCPTSQATTSSWQSSANYSNSMISLMPSLVNGHIAYESDLATTRNLPIAQAGQSLTALPATYSNHSDGSQTQQQDFVLLGGHTQNAFINMSQVALWSLPQAAWTYFPVAQGDAGTRTDLTVRDTDVQIEPRSGHTAVLSSDGTKIIVFGGWVGDVNTPAQPQLAILNVADEYGGSGDWSWTVPDVTAENGPGADAGIYGHGAVMLQGDVMLVTGGYSISSQGSKFRRADQKFSSRSYLFNVSSSSWIASYAAPSASSSTSGLLSKTSQKAGLGIGVGFGAVAIAALLCVYFWRIRPRKQRDDREKEGNDFTSDVDRYSTDEWGMPQADGYQSKSAGMSPTGNRNNAAEQVYRNWRSSANLAERTGLLVEVPSPTRGLRRHVSGGRAAYAYEKRRNQNMEVIEEIQDQESLRSSHEQERSALQQRTATLLRPTTASDPFTDSGSPLRSHPVEGDCDVEFGRTASEREHEVQGWVHNWEKAAEALINAPGFPPAQAPASEGRSSPSKSDRTTTMLSESSGHSSWSSRSSDAGPSGIVRTLSTRSAALLNSFTTTLVGTGSTSPTAADARTTLPSQQRRHRRNSSVNSGAAPSPTRSLAQNDSDTFSTAQTSFSQLQAEGEALLGGHRSRGKSEPSSPVKDKREVGWFGSVKRAISGARPATTVSAGTNSEEGSRSSSPQKPRSRDGDQPVQRRSQSDASFLRSRRGAQDWYVDDEEDDTEIQRPSAPDGELEGDWDVERAAERRVVQLMFTVPRQRLRVVNADEADAQSERSQNECSL